MESNILLHRSLAGMHTNLVLHFHVTHNSRFMDAEVGVRDLADSFRYNVLPDIIDALGLARDKLHGDIEVFDDLPEYEKLSMLVSLCKLQRGHYRPNNILLSREPKRS